MDLDKVYPGSIYALCKEKDDFIKPSKLISLTHFDIRRNCWSDNSIYFVHSTASLDQRRTILDIISMLYFESEIIFLYLYLIPARLSWFSVSYTFILDVYFLAPLEQKEPFLNHTCISVVPGAPIQTIIWHPFIKILLAKILKFPSQAKKYSFVSGAPLRWDCFACYPAANKKIFFIFLCNI